jgi:muramidase (phage lysozyme)
MTIGEIMAAQANGSIFAAGRYQIIPETMKLALRYSGLSLGDQFSPQNQDKMAIALMMYKRPVIGQFLNGDKSISVDQAMMHLAMEWASCPRPDTGSSYYGSGNRALHSVGEVRTALLQAQSQISGKGA